MALAFSKVRAALYRQLYFGNFDNTIFLVHYPKAGSTWLRALIYATITGKNASFSELRDSFPSAERRWKGVANQKLLHTHHPVLPRLGKARRLYLARRPSDIVRSYWRHMQVREKEVANFEEFTRQFLKPSGIDSYGSCRNHLLHAIKFKKMNRHPLYVVPYEKLLSDPLDVVSEIMEFVQMPASRQAIENAIEGNQRDNMISRGRNDKWLSSVISKDSSFVASEDSPHRVLEFAESQLSDIEELDGLYLELIS